MPLPDSTKSDIANSARSHLARGIKTIKEIVAAIAKKFLITRLTDFSTITTIVKQQQQAATVADTIGQQPNGIPKASDVPTDWSIKNIQGKFGYTVRVTFTDPETGRSTDMLVTVSSNTLISSQEALQQAMQMASSKAFVRRSTNPKAADISEPDITVELLSVGRRP